MKTKMMFFCVAVFVCVLSGLAGAQDNGRLPPGRGMGDRLDRWAMPDNDEDLAGIGARCLLKISFDPSNLCLDERMMRHLWFSTGVLNKAYREVLADANCPMGLDIGSGYVSLVEGDSGTAMYSIGVSCGGVEKEKEILAMAVNNLKSALSKMGQEEFDNLMNQLSQTGRRCAEMEKQVTDLQAGIRDYTREWVTNRQDVQKKIVDLRDNLAEIDMNIRYAEVRIDEFAKQKDEVRLAVERALAADAVIEELKSIVKGAEESVVLVEKLNSAGQTQALNVQEAKEKLTRAKIELAKRIEEVRDKAGQKQLAEIDNKIGSMTSSISKFKLDKDFKMSGYNSAAHNLQICDMIELLEMKLDVAKRSYRDTLSLLEDLKNRTQTARDITVTTIGME